MGFTVATFNVQNLISPGRPFYGGEGLTEAEAAWKAEWLSDQLLALDADVVAFQEVFDEGALTRVIALTDAKAAERAGRYGGTLWRGGPFRPYGEGAVIHAPNVNGTETRPRPGLAVVSRLPVTEAWHVQDLADRPVTAGFVSLAGHGAGDFALDRLSRPIQRVRIEAEGRALTVFNAHFKSPAPEFTGGPPETGGIDPERFLLDYDPVGRAIGVMRSGVRRMAEAVALRREVVAELDRGVPVVAMGDFNGLGETVAAEILAGEAPRASYEDEGKPDGSGRYSAEESAAIRARIAALRLHSAEVLWSRRTGAGPGVFHTGRFHGRHASLDRILLSAAFVDGPGRLEHLRAYHDHLNDGGLPWGTFDDLASDHGQLVARLGWG